VVGGLAWTRTLASVAACCMLSSRCVMTFWSDHVLHWSSVMRGSFLRGFPYFSHSGAPCGRGLGGGGALGGFEQMTCLRCARSIVKAMQLWSRVVSQYLLVNQIMDFASSGVQRMKSLRSLVPFVLFHVYSCSPWVG
jgi:hypothetical protein